MHPRPERDREIGRMQRCVCKKKKGSTGINPENASVQKWRPSAPLRHIFVSCVLCCVIFFFFFYCFRVWQAPLLMRDADGVMRGATVEEERGLSYADENLFRRDVRRSTLLREMA